MPKYEIVNPAIMGPIILAPLKAAEFRAIALTICPLPTISARKDCRVGMSMAFIVPRKKASTATCQTVAVPVLVRTPKMSAGMIESPCVISRIFLFGNLSAIMPPRRVKRSMGRELAAATIPR